MFFAKPLDGKAVDLTKVLGNHFKLQHFDYDCDITVRYDTQTELNTILNACTDTLFYGRAVKWSGLFFLTQDVGVNRYRITALCINKNSVRGLLGMDEQFAELKMEIEKGGHEKLVMKRANNEVWLTPEKKELVPLLDAILDRSPESKIVTEFNPFLDESDYCNRP